MLDHNYIGSLLAVLVSLRLFAFRPERPCPSKDVLAFITKASDRAPHLEYFSILSTKYRYWKRIGGEWVICDETEFPPLVLEVHTHLMDI
jgi:hypothetical protein